MDKIPGNEQADSAITAHDYANSRPLLVFSLAALAAIGAVGAVYGTWSALDTATQEDKIAEPPNLKNVVATIGEESRDLAKDAKVRLSKGQEDVERLAREDSGDDQAVNQSVGNAVLHD